MTSTRASVTTLQLARALSVAHLDSVGLIAEHLFRVSTVQLHRGLHHATIGRITTVNTAVPG